MVAVEMGDKLREVGLESVKHCSEKCKACLEWREACLEWREAFLEWREAWLEWSVVCLERHEVYRWWTRNLLQYKAEKRGVGSIVM